MADITTRPATPEDAGTVLALVRELAGFERAPPDAVKATEADLRRGLAGPRPAFECLIAEAGGEPVGMAVFFPTFSTSEGRPGLQLHDLYVREAARGTGAGRALVSALARVALERGCTRLDPDVLDWNPARGFYEHAGLTRMDGWSFYRAGLGALVRLAAQG